MRDGLFAIFTQFLALKFWNFLKQYLLCEKISQTFIFGKNEPASRLAVKISSSKSEVWGLTPADDQK